MPILEVHACWPPKYVYGHLDLIVNVEVEGNAKTKLCTKMPISEVHACWPPKYVYGLLDLSVNVEVKGNAKTKIFSLFMDWIGDDMSQIKLIEYQTMH